MFGEAINYGIKGKKKAECLHFVTPSHWLELRMKSGWLGISSAEEDWRPLVDCKTSTSEHCLFYVHKQGKLAGARG